MKKIFIVFIVFITGIITFSCSDFLHETNPNRIELPDYFQTEMDAERAVNAIYLAIRSNNAMGEGSWQFTEDRSDNVGTLDAQSNAGVQFEFTNFTLVSTNPNLRSHWNALFTAITRSNFVLDNIDNARFTNEENRETLRAEALFLRAYVYLHAVRKWGDLPLITKYFLTIEDVNAHTFREKKELVYAQIVSDLTDALKSTGLPNHQPTAGKGRASKAAINAVLGEAYLTMAATLAENKAQNLAQAKKYLEDAYNMRTFGDLKDIPYEDVFDVAQKNTNPEIIFQIRYIQGDQNHSSAIARNTQPANTSINSLFNSTGTGTYVNLSIIKEYENDDLRKAFSVQPQPNAPDGSGQWHISKFRDRSASAGTLGRGGNDYILKRYADVILMLAEVHMLLGEEPQAIAYLDMVRERAGLPGYMAMQSDADYTAKYPTLKLAILHERRVELAFENHRWFDLLRFFNIEELTAHYHSIDMSDYGGLADPKNFGPKDIYYPIPFDEEKLDPVRMYQNPGYEAIN